jgi:hypothetical protein
MNRVRANPIATPDTLTTDFFANFCKLFEALRKALEQLVAADPAVRSEFRSRSLTPSDFSRTLLSQIVVLYLLQKKGWGGLSRNCDPLRRAVGQEHGPHENFFTGVLAPLLYQSAAAGSGSFFQPPRGYRWKAVDVPLPNRLFTGAGKGILDVLDRYHFTLDEAEPPDRQPSIDPEILGTVFERMIAENARKGLGAFYTPRDIVRYMCREGLIGYLQSAVAARIAPSELAAWIRQGTATDSILQNAAALDAALRDVTFCDPAAGSGAFLVRMMLEIVRARSSLTHVFPTSADRTPYHLKLAAIRHSLYGIDLDPGATEIARLRLWLSLLADTPDAQDPPPLAALDGRLTCADSLLSAPLAPGVFDIVISNPPYVDSERMTVGQRSLRASYARMFQTARGNWDLFVVFIEQGFRLLGPRGIICYIVPNKLLGAPYAEPVRAQLRDRTVFEVRDYSSVRVFREASVYPIVFRASNDPSSRCDPLVTVMADTSRVERTRTVPATVFYADTAWDRYFSAPDILDDLSVVSSCPPLIDQCREIRSAATVSEAYALKDVIIEAAVAHEPARKFVNTGTIDRYAFRWGQHPTRYIKSAYREPVVLDRDLGVVSATRLRQAASPKIIIGGMNRSVEAALDIHGEYLAGKSTTIIIDDDLEHLKYLLAILNSATIGLWFQSHYRSLGLSGGYLRITHREIKSIPVPKASADAKSRIVALVDTLVAAQGTDRMADEQLENEVRRLYALPHTT